ncbi:MAG: hypothetical protein RL026_2826 [Pseudomonadota bacterium]|jgi:murein DD-endopeptidase MepM/ murein hydrolase activator NlpD
MERTGYPHDALLKRLQRLKAAVGAVRPWLSRLRPLQLWNHPFRDIRLMIERDGDVSYFYVRASAQRLAARTAVTAGASLGLVSLLLVAGQMWLVVENLQLRASNDALAETNTRIARLLDGGVPANVLAPAADNTDSSTLNEATAQRVSDRIALLERLSHQVTRDLDTLNQLLQTSLTRPRTPGGAAGRLPTAGQGGVDTAIGPESEAAPYREGDLEAALLQHSRLVSLYSRLPAALPVDETEINSVYGPRRHPITGRRGFHAGVDLTPGSDGMARTVLPGTVVFAGRDGGYGLSVQVRHEDGLTSRYAHFRRLLVQEGQSLPAGAAVGVIGSSGLSTGRHLHYELLLQGRPVDPVSTRIIAEYVQQK